MNISITMDVNGTTFDLDPNHPHFPTMLDELTPFQLEIVKTYFHAIERAVNLAHGRALDMFRQQGGKFDAGQGRGWLTAPDRSHFADESFRPMTETGS